MREASAEEFGDHEAVKVERGFGEQGEDLEEVGEGGGVPDQRHGLVRQRSNMEWSCVMPWRPWDDA